MDRGREEGRGERENVYWGMEMHLFVGCVHLHDSYFHCKCRTGHLRRISLKKKLSKLWLSHSFRAFKMLCVVCTERDIFIVYTVIDGHSTGANTLFSVSIQTILKG